MTCDQTEDQRSDKELLADHVCGDRFAFEKIVQRHRNRLYAVALRTMRDPEDAADALQDALISAFRAAASFRAEAQVTTWLHRIVVNACLDRIRRKQARPTSPLPAEGPGEPADPRDAVEERNMSMIVQDALMKIPEDQRAAIVLVDVQGYSVADAAKTLDVPEGTIKSRCARGRAKLAVILGHIRNPQD